MSTFTQLINGVFKKRKPAPEVMPKPAPEVMPQLLYALKKTNTALVKAACLRGADVNAYDVFGTLASAVTPATAQDARDCFQTLLGHGFVVTREISKRIYHNVPALAPLVPGVQDALAFRDALVNADTDALRGLLARGADFDGGMSYGASPAIITAARTGDVAVINLLLAHGASPHTKISGDSSTLPLHQAVLHGHREAFLRLLDAGADPNHMWSNSDGLWTISGMAKKCKTDPGMAEFVQSVVDARDTDYAAEVSVNRAIKARRPITLKK